MIYTNVKHTILFLFQFCFVIEFSLFGLFLVDFSDFSGKNNKNSCVIGLMSRSANLKHRRSRKINHYNLIPSMAPSIIPIYAKSSGYNGDPPIQNNNFNEYDEQPPFPSNTTYWLMGSSLLVNTSFISDYHHNHRLNQSPFLQWWEKISHNRSGLLILLIPSLFNQIQMLSQAIPFVISRLSQYIQPLSLIFSLMMIYPSGLKTIQLALKFSILTSFIYMFYDTSKAGMKWLPIVALNDSYAIITGASSGLGKELAIQLYKDGYNLVLIGHNESKLHSCKQHLLSLSNQSYTIPMLDYYDDIIKNNKIDDDKSISDSILPNDHNIVVDNNNHDMVGYNNYANNKNNNDNNIISNNIEKLFSLNVVEAFIDKIKFFNTIISSYHRQMMKQMTSFLELSLPGYANIYSEEMNSDDNNNNNEDLFGHLKRKDHYYNEYFEEDYDDNNEEYDDYNNEEEYDDNYYDDYNEDGSVDNNMNTRINNNQKNIIHNNKYILKNKNKRHNNTIKKSLVSFINQIISYNNSSSFSSKDNQYIYYPIRNVELISCDLADYQTPDNIYEILKQNNILDKIDIFISNAARCSVNPVLQESIESINEMIKINVNSAVSLTKLILPHIMNRMKINQNSSELIDAFGNIIPHKTRTSRILFISSITSGGPGPNVAIYSATKAFLTSFSQSLRRELLHYGILVTVANPGAISETNLIRSRLKDSDDMKDNRENATEMLEMSNNNRNSIRKPLIFSLPGMTMTSKLTSKLIYDAMIEGKDSVTPGIMNKLYFHLLVKYLPLPSLGSIAKLAWSSTPIWLYYITHPTLLKLNVPFYTLSNK
eukprot:gene9007-12149_t